MTLRDMMLQHQTALNMPITSVSNDILMSSSNHSKSINSNNRNPKGHNNLENKYHRTIDAMRNRHSDLEMGATSMIINNNERDHEIMSIDNRNIEKMNRNRHRDGGERNQDDRLKLSSGT